MSFIDDIKARAKEQTKTIVLPEATDIRTLKAVDIMAKDEFCKIVLVGNKEKIENLNCKCIGMEYASEMIIKAVKNNLKIKEIPIDFYKDKRKRKPHLNTIRDGIRHLKIILKMDNKYL